MVWPLLVSWWAPGTALLSVFIALKTNADFRRFILLHPRLTSVFQWGFLFLLLLYAVMGILWIPLYRKFSFNYFIRINPLKEQ